MDRVAVFVDAGYLFAQGSVLLSGRKLARSEIILDTEKLVETLVQFAERTTDLDLLRIYWYDGTSTGPTSQHIALAYLPNLKVRLGFVNSVGEQKGVDSLIVTDMIALARNHAMSEAVLISGDEDLRVGVQQAQERGVRVHLVGIRPSRGSQSVFLLQEADVTYEWGEADIKPFLSCKPKDGDVGSVAAQPVATAPKKASASPKKTVESSESTESTEALQRVAVVTAQEIPEQELKPLAESIRSSGSIPQPTDGRLLARSRAAMKHDLDMKQKRTVRELFLHALEERIAAVAATKAVGL